MKITNMKKSIYSIMVRVLHRISEYIKVVYLINNCQMMNALLEYFNLFTYHSDIILDAFNHFGIINLSLVFTCVCGCIVCARATSSSV